MEDRLSRLFVRGNIRLPRNGNHVPATRPPAVRIGLAVALALIVIVASRTLPLDAMLATLREWVSARGAVGMVGFGAAYVGLVLLLVPGAALTLIAGALFGPRWGVVIVAIATSVADAVAFLLARYVAGAAVERLRRRHPRFSALDQALVEGGWRIVALLRLNPAIPYSASNYLFGASGVAFLPYLLASGLFTLPGAFAYVYLGYVGAETLSGRARSGVEWTVLVVGLVATVATVVYVTVLARRALATLEERQV